MTVIDVDLRLVVVDGRWPGPALEGSVDLLTLLSIRIFGGAERDGHQQLQDKGAPLGTGEAAVDPPHAGFGRLETSE